MPAPAKGRLICACGRLYNRATGRACCAACHFERLVGSDMITGVDGYTVTELGAVFERADRLRSMGLIGEITCEERKRDKKRIYRLDGRAYSMADLDLHLAKVLRLHHIQQAAFAEYARRHSIHLPHVAQVEKRKRSRKHETVH